MAGNAPNVPHSSNHYAEKDSFGFDYLKYADSFVDIPGMGVYPGYEAGNSEKLRYLMQVTMQRIAETNQPLWCLEFQTGSKGECSGPAGVNRMHMFLLLLHRAQMVLGWTFRSMQGGEEQYLYGMLGHDGYPLEQYWEYKRAAEDFRKLSAYAFPYLPKPEIAVAYHYDNMLVSQHQPAQYQKPYHKQMMDALVYMDEHNIDYNIADLRNIKGTYRLLLIPSYIMMEKESAASIRQYVRNGGTVIMTGYSATVDETGKVFDEPRPGYLADVFGIRVAGFCRTDSAWRKQTEPMVIQVRDDFRKENYKNDKNNSEIIIDSTYYESLELHTAEAYAVWKHDGTCAISRNRYGKGTAYYTAVDADAALIGYLIKQGFSSGIETPAGVRVRKIAEGQYFYVNTNDTAVVIPLEEAGYGVLTEQFYQNELRLQAYDGELIVAEDN